MERASCRLARPGPSFLSGTYYTFYLCSSLNLNKRARVGPSRASNPNDIIISSSVRASHQRSGPHTTHKRKLDKDFFVSVLEASPTKRDAKIYLQKYRPLLRMVGLDQKQSDNITTPTITSTRGPVFVQGHRPAAVEDDRPPAYVALVKIRLPHMIGDQTLNGIAKTLSQLRTLGLLSIVVVDGDELTREAIKEQAWRIAYAISKFGLPGATSITHLFQQATRSDLGMAVNSNNSLECAVPFPDALESAISRGIIPVIPAILPPAESQGTVADSRVAILALIRYFTKLSSAYWTSPVTSRSRLSTSVERLIILDFVGGIPVEGHAESWHRFINLEQEFSGIISQLEALMVKNGCTEVAKTHIANLRLARESLSFLPSTSSVLITTPVAAANAQHSNSEAKPKTAEEPAIEIAGSVKTRSVQNPLIHNLLTDKPVYSSSLPLRETATEAADMDLQRRGNNVATLIKRGMSLTIYPDPKVRPWKVPQPGSLRPRLTDVNVDLARLIHLIEDSFGRKLDAKHYLDRVSENLAGIIIAGEYEGGAILTWERPLGLDEETAISSGKIVPYLDKFAVLKSRQGSGGVADIVFNAMVKDCFPTGVCWRSRVNNPVNKWYFERALGTVKLPDEKWTMFWTTPRMPYDRFLDYKAVCTEIEPSWADNTHIVD